jgi:hypothetical protein
MFDLPQRHPGSRANVRQRQGYRLQARLVAPGTDIPGLFNQNRTRGGICRSD